MPGAGEERGSTRFAKDVKPRQAELHAAELVGLGTLVTHLLTQELTKCSLIYTLGVATLLNASHHSRIFSK